MEVGILFLKCKTSFIPSDNHMNLDTAKQRIDAAIHQYGQHAAPAIDLVMNEVRSDLGVGAFNALVEEFDLELLYNIAPLESDH